MSTLMTAEIVNAVVLAAVLEADLGSHRTITMFRVLRPILTTAAIVPLFLEKVTTRGAGLTVELAGAAARVAGGLIALALMRIYRSGTAGRPASAAGWGYALWWTAVIGARALFSYGSLVRPAARPLDALPRGHRRRHHRRPDLHGRRDGPGPHHRPGRPGQAPSRSSAGRPHP